jgi:hypothetical protein
VRIVAGALAASCAVLALLVDPFRATPPASVGRGLVLVAVTDTSGMGMLISELPYNRPADCGVESMFAALIGLPLDRHAGASDSARS